jgi:hypothetical protein
MAKTQIVPPLDLVDKLGTFDGRRVARTKIKVTNAGDGLSEGMQVAPQLLFIGDKCYVVLETEISKIEHTTVDPKDPYSDLERTATLRADTGLIVDADLVKEHVQQQKLRVRKARDEAEGNLTLDVDGDDTDRWGEDPDDDTPIGEVEADENLAEVHELDNAGV